MRLESARKAYAEELVRLGEHDERIVVLDADLSSSTGTREFGKRFPDRFFNVGIAEQCMVDVAAGLASSGKIAFVSSFAMFLAGRAFEQVRNIVAHDSLNVKLVATHAGVTVGEDGSSHQCIEDLALMRTVPGMRVIAPADPVEARQAVRTAYSEEGPFYIRIPRPKVPVVFDESHDFRLGEVYVVRPGSDLTITSTGIMLYNALEAARLLEGRGYSARVLHVPTLKPVVQKKIVRAAAETGIVFTVEDHNVIGGLGSLVTEIVSAKAPCQVHRIGVPDVFGKSGDHNTLLEEAGLSPARIAGRIEKVMEERR